MLSEKIVVFEKSLIDTYNCIFLTHFSLDEAELDPKDNIYG